MPASELALPNIRKLFIPDPGYVLFSADLAGAEAQVVAWDANDEDLKAAFRAGVNVHIKNARDVYSDKVQGWSDEAIKATDHPGGVYFVCKRCVHATHNGGLPKGLAIEIGITVAEAEAFQKNWFGLHPAIAVRHEHIMDCLEGQVEGNPPRTIYNKFGYRVVFFDRMREVFTQALTWIQQSTVGLNCSKGGLQLNRTFSWVWILLHTHDELVFQVPMCHSGKVEQFRRALEVPIPYDDPLIIPWSLKSSTVSWGDVA